LTEVDGIRRALGDQQRERVVPHITLVPPVNVRADDVPEALRVLRRAAASVDGPIQLRIGPGATFHPVNPVVYLAVGGDDASALVPLRDQLLTPPLARRIDLPFVPHVTVKDDHPPERIAAALDAVAAYDVGVRLDRVHLLADGAPGPRRWNPVADVPFGPAVVVGRGGWELEVTVSELADPEVAPMLGERGEAPTGGRTVVAAARHQDVVVAATGGWVRGDEVVITASGGDPDAIALLQARL
jgi:2'-5' RNA ligase